MPIRTAPIAFLLILCAATHPGAPATAAPTGAAAPPPGDPPAPTRLVEHSTVELVLIETYVTDRQGKPIRGLTADDLVLKIDGYVRPIASIEPRSIGAPGPAAAPGPPLPAVTTAPDTAAPPVAPRFARRFVLFFDDETSSPQGLGVARQSAARFLDAGLQPADEIAIVAFRRHLRLLHDFTTDRAGLRRVLEETYEDPRRHSTFVNESEERTRELQQSLATFARSAEADFRRAVAEENRVMGEVLHGLQSLVESLAPWPGYKGIIYLGDGIPESPARIHLDRMELPPSVSKTLVDATLASTLHEEFRDLVEAASGAGVTLHSVQTAGLVAGGPGRIASVARRSNALEALSLNTGGIASSSNDLVRSLAEIDDGSREYYVIGYAPEGPPDGRYHTIELRARRGGLRIRWRRGFTRFTSQELQHRTLQAAHLLPGLHSGMRLELIAVPGPPEATGRTVDLVLHLPPGRILMLPESGRRVGRIDVGLVALGGGEETFRLARRVEIGVDPSVTQAAGLGTNLFARVRLPARAQTITAVVTDLATGEVGAARTDLAEQPRVPPPVAGLSIYSLSESSLWVEVSQTPPITDLVGANGPPSLGPALRATFAPGEPLACGFRTFVPLPGPLRLRIVSSGVRIREIDVEGSADAAVRTVRFPTTDLAEGDYVLVVEEMRPGGGSEVGRVAFAIRQRS